MDPFSRVGVVMQHRRLGPQGGVPRFPHAGREQPPHLGIVEVDGQPFDGGTGVVTVQRQQAVCAVSGGGFEWTFVGPEATVRSDDGNYALEHRLSPNPDENGTLRPTWRENRDGSAVWGKMRSLSTDAAFVQPDAIPWLLLEVVGTEPGPTGDKMTSTTYIQRVNTAGGVKPTNGCEDADQVDTVHLAPYIADYVFYKAA